MSQLILTRGNDLRKGSSPRSFFAQKLEFGPGMLVISLVMFLGLMSVVTLMHATKEVTKGFMVTSLESQREELLRDYEINAMKIAKASSMVTIQETDQFKSMVRPRSVSYVYSDGTLASR